MKSVMKGSELRELRLDAGLSQLRLASLLDSEQRQISLWEHDLVKINKIKALAIYKVISDYSKFIKDSNEKATKKGWKR